MVILDIGVGMNLHKPMRIPARSTLSCLLNVVYLNHVAWKGTTHSLECVLGSAVT